MTAFCSENLEGTHRHYPNIGHSPGSSHMTCLSLKLKKWTSQLWYRIVISLRFWCDYLLLTHVNEWTGYKWSEEETHTLHIAIIPLIHIRQRKKIALEIIAAKINGRRAFAIDTNLSNFLLRGVLTVEISVTVDEDFLQVNPFPLKPSLQTHLPSLHVASMSHFAQRSAEKYSVIHLCRF